MTYPGPPPPGGGAGRSLSRLPLRGNTFRVLPGRRDPDGCAWCSFHLLLASKRKGCPGRQPFVFTLYLYYTKTGDKERQLCGELAACKWRVMRCCYFGVWACLLTNSCGGSGSGDGGASIRGVTLGSARRAFALVGVIGVSSWLNRPRRGWGRFPIFGAVLFGASWLNGMSQLGRVYFRLRFAAPRPPAGRKALRAGLYWHG